MELSLFVRINLAPYHDLITLVCTYVSISRCVPFLVNFFVHKNDITDTSTIAGI